MSRMKPAGTPVSEARPHNHRLRSITGCLTVGLFLSAPVSAEIYTVGTGSCSHTTLANALTTAENHPGPDTIRITRSATYTQQAISFTTSQELTLTGGYADCSTGTEDEIKTTLDGSGGAHASVLKIHGNTGSLIHLHKLAISGGDVQATSTDGGGIDYTGNGQLDIVDTQISNNTGAYGGGINAGGLDNAAEVDIGPNVTITNNVALFNGGGLYSNNIETAIRGESSILFNNHALGSGSAGGFGGGIHIRACDQISAVYLGNGNLLGAVSANDARYGGGVAIETPGGCSKAADLRIFSTSPTMTAISGNSATVSGGGVYIFRAGGTANVYAWNASITGNVAPVAAAMYLGDGGNAYFNEYFAPVPPRPDGALDCAVGIPCGGIRDNDSADGQVVYGEANNHLELQHVEVKGNAGSELIRVNTLDVRDSLIAENMSSLRLLETHDGVVSFSTLAGNQVGGSQVLGINTGGTLGLYNSVVWQPGKVILHNDGAAPTVQNIVANEVSSLAGPGVQHVLLADPRFIDPHPGGDYRPTAGSPVVDYAAGGALLEDLLTRPRGIDLPLVDNLYGPTDVGAYERQAVQPLAENGDFATGVRVWTVFNGIVASYDSAQNAPGSTGGSMHIKQSTTSDTVVGAVQCIHLPGPGDYSLNGSGKVASGGSTPGNAHYAVLAYELRFAGSETCTGTPDATGTHTLASTGTSWNRPASPSHIVVTPEQFTSDTSIAVYLTIKAGQDNGGIDVPAVPTLKEGWIDRVTLDIDDPASDIIFRNGFEGP